MPFLVMSSALALPAAFRTIEKTMPGNKPTKKDYLGRIRLVADMMARGYRKADIKTVCRRRFGVCYRTVENYISKARKFLLSELATTREDQKARALDLYRGVIRDSSGNVTVRERLIAQTRVDKILGLEEPLTIHQQGIMKHEHTAESQLVDILRDNPEKRDVVLDLARRVGMGQDSGPFITG